MDIYVACCRSVMLMPLLQISNFSQYEICDPELWIGVGPVISDNMIHTKTCYFCNFRVSDTPLVSLWCVWITLANFIILVNHTWVFGQDCRSIWLVSIKYPSMKYVIRVYVSLLKYPCTITCHFLKLQNVSRTDELGGKVMISLYDAISS